MKQPQRHRLQFRLTGGLRMVPSPAQQHRAAVGHLCEHKRPRNFERPRRIIRPAILSAPQQDVARRKPGDARQKPAVLESTMRTYGMGARNGRAWIFNEAHGLRKDAIRKLLTLIESPLPPHVCFVFTTTLLGQKALFDEQIDASPLLHRCTRIELAQQGLARAFAERAREIAIAEGLDGQPIERYVELVNENKGSMRGTLEAIERGAMQLEGGE